MRPEAVNYTDICYIQRYAPLSDINECGTDADNCAATDSNSFCVNQVVSFVCRCGSGFRLEVDSEGKCIGMTLSQGFYIRNKTYQFQTSKSIKSVRNCLIEARKISLLCKWMPHQGYVRPEGSFVFRDIKLNIFSSWMVCVVTGIDAQTGWQSGTDWEYFCHSYQFVLSQLPIDLTDKPMGQN